MQPCPICATSRTLRTRLLIPKPRSLPRQRLRTLSTWSNLSHPQLQPAPIHSRNPTPRLTASKLPRARNSSTVTAEPSEVGEVHETPPSFIQDLPICCPGCGAYSQTTEPNGPGYYSSTRKQTRKYLAKKRRTAVAAANAAAAEEAQKGEGFDASGIVHGIEQLSESLLPSKPRHDREEEEEEDTYVPREIKQSPPRPVGIDLVEENKENNRQEIGSSEEDTANAVKHLLETSAPSEPVCDRCNNLINHNEAVHVPAPTPHTIREYLDESPHRDNRVYHIIDAADFPMSLMPDIYEALSLQGPRSQNRRSKTSKYKWGRKLPTVSFIITRSDLLAPTKEGVDSKMAYIREVLRKALEAHNEVPRLGNVHMISAKRGWWTKEVKSEIKDHGGGIWVVGKSNVGKSNFIEACFPKDSRNAEKIAELMRRREEEEQEMRKTGVIPSEQENAAKFLDDPDSLLPPAPREDLYPNFPVISSRPGATVMPIRLPFGNGKGEMIDLPGFDRRGLNDYVRDEYQDDLLMIKRRKPERFSIKPGQSLLIGSGLIRITPVTNDQKDVLMAACFLPLSLDSHITKTEKAIEMQTRQRKYPDTDVRKEDVGSTTPISSAGLFNLETDVTRSHLPTSMAKNLEDHGIKPPPLPYKVMAADILIEGCGWIELTMQVRTKSKGDGEDAASASPQVEVFSPYGQHVGSRPPIESYGFIVQKRKWKMRRTRRSRPSNINHKKRTVHGSKRTADGLRLRL